MTFLTLEELRALATACDDIADYLTDNSCSDPDCCGGPYSSVEAHDAGIEILHRYGLRLHPEEQA